MNEEKRLKSNYEFRIMNDELREEKEWNADENNYEFRIMNDELREKINLGLEQKMKREEKEWNADKNNYEFRIMN